jgi:hypothetical protein
MQFLTDPEGIRELLPEPFAPAEKPIVAVLHTWFENVDVMDGGAYALSSVLVAARFDGDKDHSEGLFPLIMPENNNYPMLMGIVSPGTGKFFGEIQRPYQLQNQHTVCQVRSWGYDHESSGSWQPFYGVDYAPMKKCDEAGFKKWQKAISPLTLFNLKVIPGYVGSKGPFDAFYPNQYGFQRDFLECWEGTSAEFRINEKLDESLTMERRIIAGLKKLPVREVLGTCHWHANVWTLGSLSKSLA